MADVCGGTSVEHLVGARPVRGLHGQAEDPFGGRTAHGCENRRARHEYHILDTLEAGVVLSGSEVKSLRAGRAHLTDAYVRIERGEMWLVNAHIAEYAEANRYNHESRATRKLLVRRAQIDTWHRKIREKGLTGVPLSMYFKGSWVKVKVALVKGKAEHDKRAAIKEKQDKREMARALKDRG